MERHNNSNSHGTSLLSIQLIVLVRSCRRCSMLSL